MLRRLDREREPLPNREFGPAYSHRVVRVWRGGNRTLRAYGSRLSCRYSQQPGVIASLRTRTYGAGVAPGFDVGPTVANYLRAELRVLGTAVLAIAPTFESLATNVCQSCYLLGCQQCLVVELCRKCTIAHATMLPCKAAAGASEERH